MEWVTISLIILVLSFLLYYSTRRPHNFPPGRRRIPIIGQAVTGAKPKMDLWNSHNIIGFFIGNNPAVRIQDFHLAKELLNREEWCGRGVNLITRYLRSDSGVNKVWLQQIKQQLMILCDRASLPLMVKGGWNREDLL